MQHTDIKIIVSLTTIHSRVQFLLKVLKSIFDQTIKADEIVLNISSEPYLFDLGIKWEDVPGEIKLLNKQGKITISYVPNTGPYRKLLPTLEKYNLVNTVIITADDDTIYPSRWIESLIQSHLMYPAKIISCRGRIMTFEDSKLTTYKKWIRVNSKPSEFTDNYLLWNLLPTGCHGTLYFHNALSQHVFDPIFLNVCPTSDDIWFKLHSVFNNVKSCLCTFPPKSDMPFFSVTDQKIDELTDINLRNPSDIKNDYHLKRTLEYFTSFHKMNLLDRLQLSD